MPRNSAAPDRDPGGSTSGPAAAVAGGICELGLGTDTLGSIRVPASYCGVWGFRPTHGRIPVEGVMPLAQSFDTVGVLADEPERLQRAAEVLLGEPAASGSPPSRLLIARTPVRRGRAGGRRGGPIGRERPGGATRRRGRRDGDPGRCALCRGRDGGLQRAAGCPGVGQLRGLGRAHEPVAGARHRRAPGARLWLRPIRRGRCRARRAGDRCRRLSAGFKRSRRPPHHRHARSWTRSAARTSGSERASPRAS